VAAITRDFDVFAGQARGDQLLQLFSGHGSFGLERWGSLGVME
jgi:hypothetical protein